MTNLFHVESFKKFNKFHYTSLSPKINDIQHDSFNLIIRVTNLFIIQHTKLLNFREISEVLISKGAYINVKREKQEIRKQMLKALDYN